MTGGDLINSALRLIGVLASGETPSASESNDALLIAQQMLDSWQAESINIYSILRSVFTLTVGQQVYTLGTGGNFNLARPARVERISVIILNNPSQPLELPLDMLNYQDWQEIPVKNILSAIPTRCYDDGQFPSRNLNYWPIPAVPNQTGIYSWQPLNTFPDLTTDVVFPPGYLKGIRYNLAVDLAPEFGRPVPPEVATQAVMAKAVFQVLNLPWVRSYVDVGLVNPRSRVYNWLTDQPAARR